MGMNKEWEAVREFHSKFDHPVSDTPVLIQKERAEKRYKWMLEEIDEFLEVQAPFDHCKQLLHRKFYQSNPGDNL